MLVLVEVWRCSFADPQGRDPDGVVFVFVFVFVFAFVLVLGFSFDFGFLIGDVLSEVGGGIGGG